MIIITFRKNKHPNFVRCFGYTKFKEDYFIITETISNILNKKSLNLTQKLKLSLELSLSVQYLHKNGILYQNFNPKNLFLDKENNSKIYEFGLESMKSLEVFYFSPESLESNIFSIYSDSYSFGSFLYEFFHDEKAFEGINQDKIKELIIKVIFVF